MREEARKIEAANRRLNVVQEPFRPVYVVWELTLRCDHACHHCGSRAVKARTDELTTDQALGVVQQLAAMGAKEVVLIGGEAYLHEGFLTIIRALKSQGITPVMTTGGMGITMELALAMAHAGMARVSVSIDGLESTHDTMRNRRGSFQSALAALKNLKTAGIDISTNSNFNRLNRDDLEPLYELLRSKGVRSWQIQLTAPLGRAADRPAMLFQPWDLLDFLPRVARLKERGFKEGLLVMPGNNLGYYGPEEGLLRSQTPDAPDRFQGCQAGRYVLGIESSGDVKGCPSLQTASYVGGNLQDHSLKSIWDNSPQLSFTRERTVEDLWGYCRECPFASHCLGGCSFTSHSFFGRPGNNPYCHFRARAFAKEGKRERLILQDAAKGLPFDHGLFEIVIEDLDAPDNQATLSSESLVQIGKRPENRTRVA